VLNVTPAGSEPVSLSVGAGVPVAVTVNVPAAPTVKVVLVRLVIAGATPTIGAGFTVSVKLCIAFGSVLFVAVKVIGNVPLTVGVPLST